MNMLFDKALLRFILIVLKTSSLKQGWRQESECLGLWQEPKPHQGICSASTGKLLNLLYHLLDSALSDLNFLSGDLTES